MSPTAPRTGPTASRRIGATPGADGSGHEARRDDRPEGTRATGTSAADALEPHWQSSIESATD
jgi:hypothetical protein